MISNRIKLKVFSLLLIYLACGGPERVIEYDRRPVFNAEPMFGISGFPTRWSMDSELENIPGPGENKLYKAEDIRLIKPKKGKNDAEIILVVDGGFDVIIWIRVETVRGTRQAVWHETYGQGITMETSYRDLSSIAVASPGPYFDPENDFIFTNDLLRHSIVKLKYIFNPSLPAADKIYASDRYFLDSLYYPSDLEYVNFGTGQSKDNRLVALCESSGRLVIYSHDGAALDQLDLKEICSLETAIFHSFVFRRIDDRSVWFYVGEINMLDVHRIYYSIDSGASYMGSRNFGTRMKERLSSVTYSPLFGLWVCVQPGNHIYAVKDDLSEIISDLGNTLRTEADYQIRKIQVFPERIASIEGAKNPAGLSIRTMRYDQELK